MINDADHHIGSIETFVVLQPVGAYIYSPPKQPTPRRLGVVFSQRISECEFHGC
jgi:hypothetical protein